MEVNIHPISSRGAITTKKDCRNVFSELAFNEDYNSAVYLLIMDYDDSIFHINEKIRFSEYLNKVAANEYLATILDRYLSGRPLYDTLRSNDFGILNETEYDVYLHSKKSTCLKAIGRQIAYSDFDICNLKVIDNGIEEISKLNITSPDDENITTIFIFLKNIACMQYRDDDLECANTFINIFKCYLANLVNFDSISDIKNIFNMANVFACAEQIFESLCNYMSVDKLLNLFHGISRYQWALKFYNAFSAYKQVKQILEAGV